MEGLNRSAAVVIAFLMQSTPCTLEDAFFYTQVLRPFIRVNYENDSFLFDLVAKDVLKLLYYFFQLDDECMACLLKLEKKLFGSLVTDLDELWI